MIRVLSNCLNKALFFLLFSSKCYHIMLTSNQKKRSWGISSLTRSSFFSNTLLFLYFYWWLILRKLYVFAVEMIQICCTSTLKGKLERTLRNKLQMTRSSEMPSDSSIVDCEYTIQFYAVWFLKEEMPWLVKNASPCPVNNFQKLFHILLVCGYNRTRWLLPSPYHH